MCGIIGYIGKRGFDADAFGRALDVMAARGPDDRGIYEEPEVLLGHRRLAIIDLSPGGHQPMVWGTDDGLQSRREFQLSAFQLSAFPQSGTAAGRYVIVFNGEIYNYQAIRRELEKEGVAFRTNSDTEVILASYAHKGVSCLDDFRGMFAFAIYDRLEKSVFLARDRMGIKPLYLWRFPGGIAFASEVKALRALPGAPSEVDVLALWDYLLWGSVAEPRTITQGIECLPPATWLKWTAGRETQETYWHFPTGGPIFTRREEALEALRPVLREAVALRCVADVPVGAFLSGGVDSSSVVNLMRAAGQTDLRTFSISFPQTDLDEAPYALKIAEQFRTRHTDISLTQDMVLHELDGFFAAMDQPTYDGLNTYLVSQMTALAGIKVALSGLGGDELFAGYPSFRRITRAQPLFSALPRTATRAIGQVAHNFPGRSKKLEAFAQEGSATDVLYFAARGVFMPSQARALLNEDVVETIASRQHEPPPCQGGGRGRSNGRSLSNLPWPLLGKEGNSAEQSAHAVHSQNGRSVLHQVMQLELRRYMHNQLLRDSDVFGLAHGLEIRVPLIDHVLAETLFKTHHTMILQGAAKSLLLDALREPLPRLCTHRPKMGFTFPFDQWMKGAWRPVIEDTLLSGRSGNGTRSLLDPHTVERIWDGYLAGDIHWSRPWALYVAMRHCQIARQQDHGTAAPQENNATRLRHRQTRPQNYETTRVGSRSSRSPLLSKPPQRILVFRIGQLGDTLLALPAMWAVRQQFPGASLTLLCDRHPGKPHVPAPDLLRGAGIFDRFESYAVDDSVSGRSLWPLRMSALLLKLRAQRYDLVVYLAPSARTPEQIRRDRKFFSAAGIRQFVGMHGFPEFPAQLRGQPLEATSSEADLLLARLAADGIPVPDAGQGALHLNLGAEEEAEVQEWLTQISDARGAADGRSRTNCGPGSTAATDGRRTWIGIGPGSKMPAKRWSEEGFLEVVTRLIGAFDVWPVVFGGGEDHEMGERLLGAWGRGYNAAGALTLRGAAAALKRCALFLGNDTGTMHLAAAVQTACVAVFSARATPGTWYPYGVESRILRAHIECEGCGLVECLERRNECLNRISATEVLTACQELLTKPARERETQQVTSGELLSSEEP